MDAFVLLFTLAVLLAVGMPVASWGTLSNATSRPFSEVLV